MVTIRINTTPVSELMTTDLHKVTPDNPLKDAQKLFKENHIRHLPVVQEGKLVGIISLTDLQRLSFGDAFGEEDTNASMVDMLTVGQVMKHKPVTVNVEDSIQTVAQILTEAEFHALPVLEGQKLVGIVTTTDIIRFLLEQFK